MKSPWILLTGLGLAIVMNTGCKSTGETTPAEGAIIEERDAQTAQAAGGSDGQTYGIGAEGELSSETLEGGIGTTGDARPELLSQRSIYFALDSDTITPEYQEVIEEHAKYLASNPDTRVTLEGHADERGTREYNLALGERRAQSVKRLMTLVGVLPVQVRTVSYGEEQPHATGHNEESWRLNRRVDLIY